MNKRSIFFQWFFAMNAGKASQCTGLWNLKPSDSKCWRDCFIIVCSGESKQVGQAVALVHSYSFYFTFFPDHFLEVVHIWVQIRMTRFVINNKYLRGTMEKKALKSRQSKVLYFFLSY